MARTDVVSLPLSICIFKALMSLKHPSVGANSDICAKQLQPGWTTYIWFWSRWAGVRINLGWKYSFFCVFLYSWSHWSSHVGYQLCWKMKGRECSCSSDCAIQFATYSVCATNMNFLREKVIVFGQHNDCILSERCRATIMLIEERDDVDMSRCWRAREIEVYFPSWKMKCFNDWRENVFIDNIQILGNTEKKHTSILILSVFPLYLKLSVSAPFSSTNTQSVLIGQLTHIGASTAQTHSVELRLHSQQRTQNKLVWLILAQA